MTGGVGRSDDTLQFVIREEADDDASAIDVVTRAAFRNHPHSEQTEHLIVQALRARGALSLSLVATLDGMVVGHLAFSPVTVGGSDLGWWGLGPPSVSPVQQGRGIGSALMRSGLRRLAERQVAGCVVLGDPAYYARFGFTPHTGLFYTGPASEFFLALALQGAMPSGEVAFHPACAPSGCDMRV
jgi:putative acetyltransferase